MLVESFYGRRTIISSFAGERLTGIIRKTSCLVIAGSLLKVAKVLSRAIYKRVICINGDGKLINFSNKEQHLKNHYYSSENNIRVDSYQMV